MWWRGKGVAMIPWPPFDGPMEPTHIQGWWRAFNFRGEIYGTDGEN